MASIATRRAGNSTFATSDGSRTLTVHDSQPLPDASPADSGAGGSAAPGPDPAAVGSLRLRGVARERRRVVWSEETVDNEGMGKKKSKICCIYRKPRAFDESSSEESDDEDGSGPEDDGRARPSNLRSSRRGHHHHHNHDECSFARDDMNAEGGSVVHELEEPEPNAYERLPKGGKGKGKAD